MPILSSGIRSIVPYPPFRRCRRSCKPPNPFFTLRFKANVDPSGGFLVLGSNRRGSSELLSRGKGQSRNSRSPMVGLQIKKSGRRSGRRMRRQARWDIYGRTKRFLWPSQPTGGASRGAAVSRRLAPTALVCSATLIGRLHRRLGALSLLCGGRLALLLPLSILR
jgi:hypothetical protein